MKVHDDLPERSFRQHLGEARQSLIYFVARDRVAVTGYSHGSQGAPEK